MSQASPSPSYEALVAEVAELRRLLVQQSALVATEPNFKVKVADPPTFDGTRKKDANTFLAHVKLNFSANPSSFPTDTSKIVYAASWLRGKAFEWFEPMLRSGDASNLSWSQFEHVFLHSHGDPDHKRRITRELLSLTQTDSAASYATRFFQLSSQLAWNDEALRAQFYEGLADDVKDALAYSEKTITDVQDLANHAVKLDNRLSERPGRSIRQPDRSQPRDQPETLPSNPGSPEIHPVLSGPAPSRPGPSGLVSSGPASPGPAPSGPTPMDLDATAPRYQPLTEAEKRRRRELGLCMYCGGPGHIARFCPEKNNHGHRPAAHTAAAVSFRLGGPGSWSSTGSPPLATVVSEPKIAQAEPQSSA